MQFSTERKTRTDPQNVRWTLEPPVLDNFFTYLWLWTPPKFRNHQTFVKFHETFLSVLVKRLPKFRIILEVDILAKFRSEFQQFRSEFQQFRWCPKFWSAPTTGKIAQNCRHNPKIWGTTEISEKTEIAKLTKNS